MRSLSGSDEDSLGPLPAFCACDSDGGIEVAPLGGVGFFFVSLRGTTCAMNAAIAPDSKIFPSCNAGATTRKSVIW